MIKVTFDADGESELREDWCPAVRSFDDPPRAPQDGPLARVDGLVFCGRDVRPLRVLRGCTVAFVWRITGGLGEGEPLTGEWAWCQIETETEQIARLEWELAAERARMEIVRAWVVEQAQDARRRMPPVGDAARGLWSGAEAAFDVVVVRIDMAAKGIAPVSA